LSLAFDAKRWGGDFIIHIAGKLISEPVSCKRVPAHHPFVIPTVNIIEVVMLWDVGDVEVREVIRSCFWAKFVLNVQLKFNSMRNMCRVCLLHISEGAIRRSIDNLPIRF
jgi:hypothetical protein